MNATVLSKMMVDDMNNNVIFLDDGRIIVKNMGYITNNPLSKTTFVTYTWFVLRGIHLTTMIPGVSIDIVQNLANAWQLLSNQNSKRYQRYVKLFNDYDRDQIETDRKKYYKELFETNVWSIGQLPLPSLLILKIAEYKTDHVLRVSNAIEYHEKAKIIEHTLAFWKKPKKKKAKIRYVVSK